MPHQATSVSREKVLPVCFEFYTPSDIAVDDGQLIAGNVDAHYTSVIQGDGTENYFMSMYQVL